MFGAILKFFVFKGINQTILVEFSMKTSNRLGYVLACCLLKMMISKS